MLVYGDRARTLDPHRALAELAGLLDGAAPPDRLRTALILAGELAQGLADAETEGLGRDDLTPLQAAAMGLAIAIAGRAHAGTSPEAGAAALAALRAVPLPAAIRCKQGEGFAFYAVYPDCFAAAATAHPWGAPPLAIGLRSIGTTLAATVAAVTGGRAISLRPRGHPFRRELCVSDRLRAALAAHPGPFAIVDEGPGLSGSSLGCVADLLEDLGVARERIVFMPSHPGPLGPEASIRHRARWEDATRLVRTVDDLFAAEPPERWFEADIGPAVARDISAGAWRCGMAEPLPPAAPAWERRKVRLTARQGDFVARFAGLGRIGEDKLARARALHAAGFGPEPIALRRGFLLERWVDRTGLDQAEGAVPVGHLGRYLGFRAEAFPASEEEGATVEELRRMAVANAGELCGEAVAERVAVALDRLAPGAARVHVDGRLHAWEWRRRGDRLCKLDGLDHSCGHDLVGAQDIAWDVAGASIELGLGPDATAALTAAVGTDAARVAAMALCYATFQGGLWEMAAGSAATPAEAARLRRQTAFYADAISRLLARRA